MPRSGAGQYSLPPGLAAVANETITSAQFNGNLADLETDANTARPVATGGTGATTAATAISNLGGATAVVNSSDTTVGRGLIVGSFGIGGEGITTSNCNDAVGVTAIYRTVGGSTTNTPVDFSGTLVNFERGGDISTQWWSRHNSNVRYTRQRTAVSTFTDWEQIVSVVETGGTALDGYEKYSDGRMKAWALTSASMSINTAFGGGYRTTSRVWTYLKPFTTQPIVHVTANDFTAFGASLAAASITAASYFFTDPAVQSNATRTAMLTAEGRY
jgi:hypothetical protein